jgi:hypothetical protein
MAVRSLHDRNVRPDAIEPHDAIHPTTFDGPLALQHEPELNEELSRGREVVNHDADMVHPLDSHVLDRNEPDLGRDLWKRRSCWGILPTGSESCQSLSLSLLGQQASRPFTNDRHLLPDGVAIEYFFEPVLIPRGNRPRSQLLDLLAVRGACWA